MYDDSIRENFMTSMMHGYCVHTEDTSASSAVVRIGYLTVQVPSGAVEKCKHENAYVLDPNARIEKVIDAYPDAVPLSKLYVPDTFFKRAQQAATHQRGVA